MNNKILLSPQYIAGLMDEEGSFSYVKFYAKHRKKYYYRACVQFTQKNSVYTNKLFEKLKNKYGGSFTSYTRYDGFSKTGTTFTK
jgi:hypothetical protein